MDELTNASFAMHQNESIIVQNVNNLLGSNDNHYVPRMNSMATSMKPAQKNALLANASKKTKTTDRTRLLSMHEKNMPGQHHSDGL